MTSPHTPTQPILYSKYDYDTQEEIFPTTVPVTASLIIHATIFAIATITSPQPFQIFAIYCMEFLSSQIIYLIQNTEEGKSPVITTAAALLNRNGTIDWPGK